MIFCLMVFCLWWITFLQSQLVIIRFCSLWSWPLNALETLCLVFGAKPFGAQVIVELRFCFCVGEWIVYRASVRGFGVVPTSCGGGCTLQPPRWSLCSVGTPRAAVAFGRKALEECGVQNDVVGLDEGASSPNRNDARTLFCVERAMSYRSSLLKQPWQFDVEFATIVMSKVR